MNRIQRYTLSGAVIATAAIVAVAFQSGDESTPASDEASPFASTPNEKQDYPVGEKTKSGVRIEPSRSIAGLVLDGTMATDADGAGVAFISAGDDAESIRYRVGDELPGGGTLINVLYRSVEVRTDAGIETLALEFKEPTGLASTQSSGLEARNASLEAAMQEARGDGVPPDAPPTDVVPVTAPTADDLRREAAKKLALDH